MKKLFFLSVTAGFMAITAQAKIWRVNNTAGITADFTTLSGAVSSASVLSGDTIHVEPSATQYSFPTVNKQLTIIGNGYLLTGTGSNAGLQENTLTSIVGGFRFSSGSAGTKIIGIRINGGSDFSSGYSGAVNITFEKCMIEVFSPLAYITSSTYSGITFRKCFFTNQLGFGNESNAVLNNITYENNIFSAGASFTPGSGTNFIFRNNIVHSSTATLSNAYVANNVFTSSSVSTFTGCNVKNNVFVANQTGVTSGPLSVNGNNLINQTLTSIIVNSGSNDGKFQLAAGSPAIGGGVDISGTKPDCGAFGGNDPYKLSGIPGIPTIYALTVPASVPLGTPAMSVTISTRNNN
ncbi:MAG: hypothetical protein U0V75_02225 [Ferruginibacter sp.]